MHDPQSLHKSLYGHADPINNIDPTGEWSLSSTLTVTTTVGAVGGFSYGIYRGAQETGTVFSWKTLGYGLIGGAIGAAAGAAVGLTAHGLFVALANASTASVGSLLYEFVVVSHPTFVYPFVAGVVTGMGLGLVAPESTAAMIASFGLGGGSAGIGALSWQADALLFAHRSALPSNLRSLYFTHELFRNWRNRPVSPHGITRGISLWSVSFAAGFGIGFTMGISTRFATDAAIDAIELGMNNQPQLIQD